MKIYLKVFGILIAVMTAIILVTMVTSILLMRNGLEQTIISQIEVICEVGERLISTEITLLDYKIEIFKEKIRDSSEDNLDSVLDSNLRSLPDFTGAALIHNDEIINTAGPSPISSDFLENDCVKEARLGLTYVTTTIFSHQGTLNFFYCSPIQVKNYIIVLTMPWNYFSQYLSAFEIWDTGSLFLMDNQGTIIANRTEEFVFYRANALNPSPKGFVTQGFEEFTKVALQGGSGYGRYTLDESERLAVFSPVSGSQMGWIFGVSAPIGENPGNTIYNAIFLTSFIFLIFGICVSHVAARFIAKQFLIINEQNKHLYELNEIARNASDTKTHFLANMSHEMRTPLNAIVGFSELMLNGIAKKEDRMDNLRKIHTAGTTLLGIVNDILDISKIESGKFEMIPVEYEVASLINDTVTVNMVRIGEKDIIFRVIIDPHIPARLIGDELRIKQICNNFLSNAFKYTREGIVTLEVSCYIDEDDVWLMISVTDSGIGIKKEDIEKLFSAYNQVDTKSNRAIEGTGLGLSIAKRMAQMMEGTIDVESEYGMGSKFTATIRQKYVTDEILGEQTVKEIGEFKFQSKKSALNHQMAISKLPYARILLVDDVQTNLDVARGMFTPYEMKIDCVTSGQQAIKLIKSEEILYDAIFMDHMMPGMDGIEATRIIREEIGTDYAKNIPIIALTANAIVGNEKLFLEKGFQAYLSKPINMNAVNSVLEQWVRDKAKEEMYSPEEIQQVYPDANSSKGTANIFDDNDVEGIDFDQGLERFSGDFNIYQNALRSYANNTEMLLDAIKEPDADDLKNYIITVHGIKSSSYGICANGIGKVAEELERHGLNDDFKFISENNQSFIQETRKLIERLNLFLLKYQKEKDADKPTKDDPDAELIESLIGYCQNYDMDGIDKIIEDLSQFSYVKYPDLVPWLEERVDLMELDKIIERFQP
ncbi:MAG: response regulator [Deltaproteobacteria bacterium]|jgi:signal transduction histidine kinase/DNA-binding NarL/FixJ family response regulator|nr:response regulator [Deltaproteobacteria bacterium]